MHAYQQTHRMHSRKCIMPSHRNMGMLEYITVISQSPSPQLYNHRVAFTPSSSRIMSMRMCVQMPCIIFAARCSAIRERENDNGDSVDEKMTMTAATANVLTLAAVACRRQCVVAKKRQESSCLTIGRTETVVMMMRASGYFF